MLWEKKAPAEAKAGSSSEKKKKYEKQVYYGSPLDREAFAVAEANRAAAAAKNTVFSDLKALLTSPRKRLRLDPQKHLYFLHDPGKHVASAITIKNISRTHVAFKFRTTAPQNCFMRPNGGVLPPNESIIAIVTKYIEKLDPIREREQERKTKDKFKIISLPVKPDADYYPDMFEDDEDNVSVERILQVVFIDPKKASPEQVSKLQRRLAEAEAAEAARKKAQAEEEEEEKEEVPQVVAPVQEGQGNVINEWKQRREAFLAQQQAGGGKPL